ncbi:ribonuclease Y [Geobacter sulfurreducens]|uniref:Ribonuclease Y n=1 Tax=Geobacter sulfurreducens (strain ATCC 51573 / DSM 12127 / PCA) TaxID=243231 RepID=RNY_GEOSL|nr:ribonuclease Y [Geobacter sulfurreducens]Q74E27.1 RecName: Full=Ribonuclease Y; Short=RNase Y [Geobacter sulfurreducens PCA]AAR34513.1 endoribonuclease Y [Geobacter sulfurreducens PCA]ADI83973.1 endoribonuclease Y [Geobacter sulfurreducens KN400]QVW36362.1 ribonuclease Y [Geobacter sulfurreducens]UAC05177.1 ribonuclease Y [Geobacter sulfurreducens]UTG93814.1 ribonuclease Y [Geobacter sulfurreducens]
MKIELAIIFIVLAAGAGFLIGNLLRKKLSDSLVSKAEELASRIVEDAKREAETISKEAALQAKDVVYQAKADFEREAKEKHKDLQTLEKRLQQKEENLDKKMNLFDQRDADLTKKEQGILAREQSLNRKEESLDALVAEQRAKLEQISGMSSAEAKKILMDAMESEAKLDAAKRIKAIEEEARETADKKSKEIISLAVQRYAGEYVAEKTVSVVALPSDEMKGRIIGREGRNIRALEAATGIDLIIDDTPEAVILSGFNPVRREVAKIALEKLITDGRIHPGRIEEVVAKAEEEVEQAVKEAGDQAAFDLGVHGIHPEILKLIGRLKYRTSYSQNVYQHSLEVAFLCGIMASELGINVKQAKRAGLLHDLGKAVDHEVEGSHAVIGAELARKYGESPKIVHAIMAHHEDEKPNSILAVLVQAADALSGARPGARREMMETYVKRLEDLERISCSFGGVNNSFAIQAGREIRVMVSSEEVSDERAVLLAKDIAKKIEAEMTYPGQIKVNVIRETRAIEYAR